MAKLNRSLIVKPLLLITFTACYGQLFAQSQKIMASPIPDVAVIKPNDSKIKIPQCPAGCHLTLKGSDHTPIIDSSGKIVNPLVDTKVNLYFQLISDSNDTLRFDIPKQVMVPGKFIDRGTNLQPFVIPALREWHGDKGNFNLLRSSKIVLDVFQKDLLRKTGEILQKEIKLQTGFNLKIIFGKPLKGDLYLTLNETDASIGEEGYYFKVTDFVKISASKYQGLFWGTRTLLQLLESSHAIPKGIARDYPEFKVRGFVLDDGRKFFTLQFLQDYVKLMSYYKMNDFQIHLNDNGFKKFFNNSWDSTYSAFRLQNSTYPGLTAKDGSYTKKEFIALQELAKNYAVNIIPEIDVPAHSLAFTKAIPKIGSKEYGMDHLDLHNPLTYQVIENVFKEYLSGNNPVFKGEEIHIGTDEYAKEDAEAFRAFTDHFIKYVQSFGKNVRLWGALTHARGNTPVTVKNVTMNTWYNGYANPLVMKELGYKQISTPDGWLYIVPAAGYYYDYLDYKNIYNNWTPLIIGNVHFTAGDPSIIGGSFAEWNDIVGNGISEKDVNDRVFPAMQVLAEKMWAGNDTVSSYTDFELKSKSIAEGPSINIRGKLSKPNKSFAGYFSFNNKSRQVKTTNVTYVKGHDGKALQFKLKNSFASLPYKEIGYDYSVSFWIDPDSSNPDNAIIFSSVNSVVKLKQKNTGQLGFSRDGYDFDFGYALPENTWTHIIITGTNKGTSLYVNGKLQKKLSDDWLQFSDKDNTKMHKVETLFFPLQKIGGFNGKLDELRIWDRVLSDQEISQIK